MIKLLSSSLAIAFALSFGNASADDYGDYRGQSSQADRNLVEVAQEAGQFNTLIAALQAAGLADTLATGGPFTVFAPTDEAFAEIPQEQLAALLEDTEALTAILTYHVVSGTVRAEQVVGLERATTLQGNDVTITVSDYGVRIDEAKVVATDIEASNGVIHVIDTVITP